MRIATIACLVPLLGLLAGCGGGKPSPEATKPFAEAIGGYLESKSMGMKVDSFDSLTITGDTATAELRMADKDVGYGMRPVWTFTFAKAGQEWRVTAATH